MKTLTITTANLCKDRPLWIRRLYLAFLTILARPGLLCLQELGHGKKSVRTRPLGKLVREHAGPQRWREIGAVGVHRWVSWRDVFVDGVRVRVITIHALHRASRSPRDHALFYAALGAWLRTLERRGIPWVVAGDFNLGLKKAAKRLGAAEYAGHGVDGGLVSAGLRIVRKRGKAPSVNWTGRQRRWTDNHPAVTFTVELAA